MLKLESITEVVDDVVVLNDVEIVFSHGFNVVISDCKDSIDSLGEALKNVDELLLNNQKVSLRQYNSIVSNITSKAYFPKLNVINSIFLVADLLNKKLSHNMALKFLKQMHLKDGSVKINKLTKAELTKLNIIYSIIKGDDIIIVPDLFCTLQTAEVEEILNILKRISVKKMVIFLTQNVQIARKYADFIAVISNGNVIKGKQFEDSKTNEIKEKKVNFISLIKNSFKYHYFDYILVTVCIILIIILFSYQCMEYKFDDNDYIFDKMVEDNNYTVQLKKDSGSFLTSEIEEIKKIIPSNVVRSYSNNFLLNNMVIELVHISDIDFLNGTLEGDFPTNNNEVVITSDLAHFLNKDLNKDIIGSNVDLTHGLIFKVVGIVKTNSSFGSNKIFVNDYFIDSVVNVTNSLRINDLYFNVDKQSLKMLLESDYQVITRYDSLTNDIATSLNGFKKLSLYLNLVLIVILMHIVYNLEKYVKNISYILNKIGISIKSLFKCGIIISLLVFIFTSLISLVIMIVLNNYLNNVFYSSNIFVINFNEFKVFAIYFISLLLVDLGLYIFNRKGVF